MAYGQTYAASDVGKVSIDFIVALGAFFLSFVALAGLVLLWNFAKSGKISFNGK